MSLWLSAFIENWNHSTGGYISQIFTSSFAQFCPVVTEWQHFIYQPPLQVWITFCPAGFESMCSMDSPEGEVYCTQELVSLHSHYSSGVSPLRNAYIWAEGSAPCVHIPVGSGVTWCRPCMCCMCSIAQQITLTHCMELSGFFFCYLQSCRTLSKRFYQRWGNRVSVCTSCQTAAASRASLLCPTRSPRPQISLCPWTSGPTLVSGALLCTSTRQAPQVQQEASLTNNYKKWNSTLLAMEILSFSFFL